MAEALDQGALENLLTMVGDDPEFVDELVDTYLADAPLQVAAIRSALDAGDAEGVVRPAHTLKGSSLNLGGLRVAGIAREIEERGRAGSLEGAAALLQDLRAANAELETALGDARARRWTSR